MSGELHRLLARQIRKCTGPDGEVALAQLSALVSAVYADMDRDRLRSERANTLMGQELAGLEQQRTRLLADLRIQNTRFEAALANMSQGLCLLDAAGRIVVSNRRFREIYLLDEAAVRAGRPIGEVLADSAVIDEPADYLAMTYTAGHACLQQELANKRILSIVHQPLPGGGSVDTFEDVTDQHNAQARVVHMARHDPLTDLPNRAMLHERLQQALTRRSRENDCAVLYLDLDRFKAVNDTLGHPVGDALLLAVAARLREQVRPCDTIARIGGDEFVVLLENAGDAAQVAVVAQRLIDDLSRPYTVKDHQVSIGVSIGIAQAHSESGDAHQLIKEADIALYCAKSEGRGCYRFFEASFGRLVEAKHSLEADLRRAVLERQFVIHYQPLMNLQPRRLNGFEALLRWNSPERGLVMPENFIPLAEETGLIETLGEWVLRTACREAAKWPPHLKLSVNLSPAQFRSRNLVTAVVAALAESGLRASQLELELTESTLMEGNESTLGTLQKLRKLGISIALDDFGTGYSSLSYLLRFPFDRIKIDRSFVGELGQQSKSMAIVRAVMGLCSGLGIKTTAEGVENVDQLALLGSEQSMEVQGFLFSTPQPAENLPLLLQTLEAPETGDQREGAALTPAARMPG